MHLAHSCTNDKNINIPETSSTVSELPLFPGGSGVRLLFLEVVDEALDCLECLLPGGVCSLFRPAAGDSFVLELFRNSNSSSASMSFFLPFFAAAGGVGVTATGGGATTGLLFNFERPVADMRFRFAGTLPEYDIVSCTCDDGDQFWENIVDDTLLASLNCGVSVCVTMVGTADCDSESSFEFKAVAALWSTLLSSSSAFPARPDNQDIVYGCSCLL